MTISKMYGTAVKIRVKITFIVLALLTLPGQLFMERFIRNL